MNSSTTTADCVDTSPLDPSKHVNFVQGMVLGVDDFQQEWSWHAGRHRALARELAGYGTVSGLRVSTSGTGASAMVAVEPGLAVTPAGELVRITRSQCAGLAAWLARPENRAQPEMLGSPGRLGVRIYVRLRYADCKLDPVPIPGEPCRTEDEAMQASRIADSWKLHLSFTAPAQHEEDALRVLVHWLKRLRLVEHAAATPADVAELLRKSAAALLAANDTPADLVLADPPEDFFVARQDLCECLRAALLVWTTELRPKLQERLPAVGGGCGCSDDANASPPAGAIPEEDVLLAELWVPVNESGDGVALDSSAEVEVREDQRPYLLHLRMLQELVTCGPDATGELALATFATILAADRDVLWVWVHHPLEVALEDAGAASVAVNGAMVTEFSRRALPGTSNVFELRFEGSPALLLQPGDRVTVSFDIDVVRERSTGHTLRFALDESYGGYLDLLDGTIVVHTIVGPLALDDLVDVDAADAADELVLTARGGRWRPEPVPRFLGELGDVDIDLATAQSGDVLTLQDERWRPEPVPRSLGDLSDVDADGISAANGDVLTLRDGRWSPEPVHLPPHTHALEDLSDVNVPSQPNEGDVLTRSGQVWIAQAPPVPAVPHLLDDLSDVNAPQPNQGDVLTRSGVAWVAQAPPQIPAPTPVHSGTLRFENIAPGSGTWFGPFNHGFDPKQPVMLRLSFFDAGLAGELAENTDTIGISTFLPHVIVDVIVGAGVFLVFLQDQQNAEGGEPTSYTLRWFAVPVTKTIDNGPPQPLDFSKINDAKIQRSVVGSVIFAEVAAGNNKLKDLATRFKLSPNKLQPILKDLGIQVSDGVVSLPVG